MVDGITAARYLITQAIKESKKGRPNVAAELSILVGVTITEYDLNEFTRARRNDTGTMRSFPMEWLPALVKVTGSHELEHFLLCQECRDLIELGRAAGKYLQHRKQEQAQKAR